MTVPAKHAPHTRTAPLVRSAADIKTSKTFFDDDVVATDVLVQTGPTELHGWDIHNAVAAVTFVVFFNAAAVADVTIGTTVPDYAISMVASGNAEAKLASPMLFPLGLVIASLTTTDGSTGAASDVSLSYL
jgi:hypothetical protein